MRHLNLAIVGGISFAAGLLVGLSIAVVYQSDEPASAKVIAERDAANSRADEIQLQWNNDATRLQADLLTAHNETALQKKTAEKITGHWIHTSVLLHLIATDPLIYEASCHPDFQQAFREADWYWPDVAFQIAGARWFRDEWEAAGWAGASPVLRQVLEKMAAAEKGEAAVGRKTKETPERTIWLAGRNQPPPQGNRRHLVTVKGMKTTDTFRVNTSKWRLSWVFIGRDSPSERYVSAYVNRANGDPVATISSDIDNNSIIRAAPGDFYLEIDASAAVAFSMEEMEPEGAGSAPEQATETIAPWSKAKHKPIRTAPW